MKKTLIIMFLALAISISLIAGTLSMYTISIDNLAQGSAVAKEFVFTGAGTDSFEQGVKIAPTEKAQWDFSVQNYDGEIVTETDLYYRLTFQVGATEDKGAIEPLLITVNDEEIETEAGVGSLEVEGEFLLDENGAENGQEDEYTVEIYWPDGDGDINYAGSSFGTTIKVAAVARQLPFDWEGPEEPEEPEEPEPSGIHVLYKPGDYTQAGYVFDPKITITNNLGEEISGGWEIRFRLPTDEITQIWDSSNFTLSYDTESGFYTIQSTYSIPIGGTRTISGKGKGLNVGSGDKPGPIESVSVNGMPVILEID